MYDCKISGDTESIANMYKDSITKLDELNKTDEIPFNYTTDPLAVQTTLLSSSLRTTTKPSYLINKSIKKSIKNVSLLFISFYLNIYLF